MHDMEFVRTVSCAIYGLPFVGCSDLNEVMHTAEVGLCEDMGGAEAIE